MIGLLHTITCLMDTLNGFMTVLSKETQMKYKILIVLSYNPSSRNPIHNSPRCILMHRGEYKNPKK